MSHQQALDGTKRQIFNIDQRHLKASRRQNFEILKYFEKSISGAVTGLFLQQPVHSII